MFLLDTNVLSELRKPPRADTVAVRDWVARRQASELFISAITVFEMELGVRRLERRDPRQGAVLRQWLDEGVGAAFAGRVLGVDVACARASARLQVPDPRPERDCFIAATALVHGLTVVTRNTRDFEPMGVALVDPWDAAAGQTPTMDRSTS